MARTRTGKTIQAGSGAGPQRVRQARPLWVTIRWCALVAHPLAPLLALLFPITTSAQAIQLRFFGLPAEAEGAALLTLTLMAVIELGAVFWVGIHLWQHLSLYPAPTRHEEEQATDHRVQDRFELRMSLPTLLVLLLAHIALLIAQSAAFVSNESVALLWLVRVLLLLLALRLSLYQRQFQSASPRITSLFSWINLLLGLVLLVALALSNDAATARSTTPTSAALTEFLHLLATTLWIGGMLSMAIYAPPISRVRSFAERVRSQVLLVPSYFPWIVAGGVLMAIAGSFAATTHLSEWEQLRTTPYGQVFIIGGGLVGMLLLAMAVHLFLLRHNVEKAYAKYAYACAQAFGRKTESHQRVAVLAHLMKRREARLAMQIHLVRVIFGLEAVLGVGAVICFSLLNIFASSLLPSISAQQRSQSTGPFQSTMQTFDKKFEATLAIAPNRFGPNVFSVRVVDTRTGAPITHATTLLITKMGEMDMGTLTLHSDGNGVFSIHDEMAMSGDWQIIIQIVTPDNVLHETYVTLFTPL